MPSGLVFNVQRFSLQDGPGVRTTVFMKGCPLACAWCHNPESQAPRTEFIRMKQRCIVCGLCSAMSLRRFPCGDRDETDVEACPTGALPGQVGTEAPHLGKDPPGPHLLRRGRRWGDLLRGRAR